METIAHFIYYPAHPSIFISIVCLLGFAFGSFLNVVIYRLPKILYRDISNEYAEILEIGAPIIDKETAELDLTFKPSFCPKCKHPIKWYYNIPLFGYFILRGKCKACKEPISYRYPLVEALGGIITVFLALNFGLTIQFLFLFIFSLNLIAIAFIDYDYQIIPDNLTLPFLWLGLLLNLNHVFVSLPEAVIGAISGYLGLWCIAKIFYLITRREGMGHGDFKYLALVGAWLGWQFLPILIFISALSATLYGAYFILFQNQDKARIIPFGPFLVLSTYIMLFFGQNINDFYLRVIGMGYV